MAALSYMQRRRGSGIYEFRKRVPKALAGLPAPAHVRDALPLLVNPATGNFKREIVLSLGTSDFATAKRLDLREAARVADLFAEAVRLMRDGPDAAALGELPTEEEVEAHFHAEVLAEDERERNEGDDRHHVGSSGDRRRWPDLVEIQAGARGLEDDHDAMLSEHIDELLAEYREAHRRGRPGIVRTELAAHLSARGIQLDSSSDAFHRLGMAALRGHVRGYEDRERRHGGAIISTPKGPPAKGPKLSEAFAAWCEPGAARGQKKPAAGSVREASNAVRRFKELHGDLRLGAITKAMARDFRDKLAAVPTRLPAKLRALPLPKLLEADLRGLPPVSAKTVNKLVTLLSGIVSKAESEGRLDDVPGFANPFKTTKLAVDSRGGGGREAFDGAELGAIFKTPVFADGERPVGGGGEAAFWFPVLALLTGARLGELAQLRACDLRQDADTAIWFFDISTSGGRSVKTASSRRDVPMHKALRTIGLIRYREAIAERGGAEARLWPDVALGDSGNRAAAWSKWFGRQLRVAAGVADTAKAFHSFRHTFKQMTRDAGLPEELHDALTGHSGGGVGRSYGGFGLKRLAEAVDEIAVPAVVAALRWSPGAGIDKGRRRRRQIRKAAFP